MEHQDLLKILKNRFDKNPNRHKNLNWNTIEEKLKTPNEIRKLGGAIFADFRFNHVFVYHNGAQSYYAGRGFRGALKV